MLSTRNGSTKRRRKLSGGRIDGALSTAFADRFADEPHADAAEGEPGGQHTRLAAQGGDGFTELVDQLQGFSPGSGLLEEEVIDEDEYDFDPDPRPC